MRLSPVPSEKYLYDSVPVSCFSCLSHLQNQVKIKDLKLNSTSSYAFMSASIRIALTALCNKWLALENNTQEFHIDGNPNVQYVIFIYHFYITSEEKQMFSKFCDLFATVLKWSWNLPDIFFFYGFWIFTAGNWWEFPLFSGDDRKGSLENNCSKAGFPIKSSNLLSSPHNVVYYF